MANLDVNKVLIKLKPLLANLIRNFLTGDYSIRRESAIALSKFKGEHATDFLLQTFESDNIQDFMALALGNIENQKAVSLLINALNDSQQEVRFHAARALGMIKSNEAFNVLMEALNEYADNSAAGISRNPQNQLFFEEEAIISAITALGKIRNHLSIALLKRLLAQEKNSRIRATIITSLGMMATEKMLPVFQAALRDEDARVRANAIEAIEAIKSSAIVGILQPYLEDPNNRVKANVAKAIWKYGDFDVSETLSQMLGSSDKWQRASAAYAMGEIKDVRFIPKLALALKDEDPEVRRNGVNALKRIESPNALPHLIPLLQDPNFEVRVHATLAISRCNPSKAPEIIFPRLKEEKNPNVRATIISCLGDSGKSNFNETIELYLDDEDPRVVANSIEALQKLIKGAPYPKLSKKLNSLLSHEDNRVKSNAIRALWNWNDYNVLDHLQDLLNNNDPKYRQSGIFALGEIGKAVSENPSFSEGVNELIHALISGKEPVISQSQPPSPLQSSPGTAAPQKPPAPESPEPSPPSPKAAFSPETPVEKPVLQPLTYEEEIEQAANAFNEKEFLTAEKIYKKILSHQPDHLKALMGIGNLYFIMKRHSEAAEIYQKALKINPNLVKAHYNLGSIFFYLKNYEEAKEHLTCALKLYPKILGAYLMLAQIFQMGERTRESIQLLSKAIELSPRNPILFQKLAVLHLRIKDYEGAVGVLQKAISLAPNDIESNVLLAFTFNLLGRSEEAFASMESALSACAQSAKTDEALNTLLQSFIFFKTNIDENKPT